MPSSGGRPLKVPKVIEKYGLGDYGDQLEEMWTREQDPVSVRNLSVKLNGKLIQGAVRQADGAELDTITAEDYYQRLKDEKDADEDYQSEASKKLNEYGVDVEELKTDFASYHSVFTYLRSRGASASSSRDAEERPEEVVKQAIKQINEQETETANEIQSQLETLSEAGVLPDEIPETEVTIIVRCAYCDATHDLRRFIRRQGCGCEQEQQPRLYGEVAGDEITVVTSS